MDALYTALDRAAALQAKMLGVALVVLGAAMCLLIFAQVFFRFVVFVPLPWSEELARYLMVWMAMLGAPLALRMDQHIGVGLVLERLPRRARLWLTLGTCLVTIAFMAVIGWQGVLLCRKNLTQVSPAMQLPMMFSYAAIPVGGVCMLLELCDASAKIVRALRAKRS